MAEKKKQSLQGWLILFIPAIVIVAVYMIFPATKNERDSLLSSLGTTNHGVLIEPTVTLSEISFSNLENKPWQVGRENTRWKLMIVDDGHCQLACQQALYITRQIHKLMPKRADRIERIFVTPDQPSLELMQRLANEYPGVTMIRDNSGELSKLVANTNIPPINGLIYLVDPRGYLVLYYTGEHDYKKIIKDLKVLL